MIPAGTDGGVSAGRSCLALFIGQRNDSGDGRCYIRSRGSAGNGGRHCGGDSARYFWSRCYSGNSSHHRGSDGGCSIRSRGYAENGRRYRGVDGSRQVGSLGWLRSFGSERRAGSYGRRQKQQRQEQHKFQKWQPSAHHGVSTAGAGQRQTSGSFRQRRAEADAPVRVMHVVRDGGDQFPAGAGDFAGHRVHPH